VVVSHAHRWVETGRRTLYVEFTQVVRGQHRTNEVWANWVCCLEVVRDGDFVHVCGAKGFRRDHSSVVYVCDGGQQ
jgi:hypothetical protein